MRRNGFQALLTLCALALPTLASAQALPSDVGSNHWAASAVQTVLKNSVMSISSDKAFHGEAKVTHKEAVVALAKLADNHMIWPGSPLLTADDKPVQGEEMSRGLMEMITGLNNKFTELGHDEKGNTIDNSFHGKPGTSSPNKK